jgi:putative membrane protein
MTDPYSAPGAGRFEVRVTADSHFSWIRTRFSLERTMMSWIRTAVSLIGFGFAIVQFP